MSFIAILVGHEVVRTNDVLEWAKWLNEADRHIALTAIFKDHTTLEIPRVKNEHRHGMQHGALPLGAATPYKWETPPGAIACVSTVFLGTWHSNGWFESMVYRYREGFASSPEFYRYETYDEAMKGHLELVDRLARHKT